MMLNRPLTTTDINTMLKSYDIFVGAFPSDQIRIQQTSSPQAFIVNTEPRTSAGEHWTALIVSDKQCLFFDSLGHEMYNVLILNALKNAGITKYKYNSCQIQSILSHNCGYFCIAFVLSFIYGHSYPTFMSNFVTKKNKMI